MTIDWQYQCRLVLGRQRVIIIRETLEHFQFPNVTLSECDIAQMLIKVVCLKEGSGKRPRRETHVAGRLTPLFTAGQARECVTNIK